MQMPKPTKHHEKLAAFAGTWTGDETIHPTPWDPAGGTAKGTGKYRMDLDGFALVQDYVQKRGGKVSYRGHGILGYSADEKKYIWHWSDSMGGVAPVVTRGEWKGSKLVFEHASPGCQSRYTYTLHKDGTLGFSIENTQDGATWTPFITARYTNKDTAKAAAPASAPAPEAAAKAPVAPKPAKVKA
jgi:hypothetical protein